MLKGVEGGDGCCVACTLRHTEIEVAAPLRRCSAPNFRFMRYFLDALQYFLDDIKLYWDNVKYCPFIGNYKDLDAWIEYYFVFYCL